MPNDFLYVNDFGIDILLTSFILFTGFMERNIKNSFHEGRRADVSSTRKALEGFALSTYNF